MTAGAIDRARLSLDESVRTTAHQRASLLTPIAKAFSTDIANEVASLGVQVHGGMGYIEETGAAQHMRDARIAAIYEGTNGIQALDLVMRKVPLDEGRVVADYIGELRTKLDRIAWENSGLQAIVDRLEPCVDALERATGWMREAIAHEPADAAAGATPYLRLFALAAGGVALAREAAAQSTSEPDLSGDL